MSLELGVRSRVIIPFLMMWSAVLTVASIDLYLPIAPFLSHFFHTSISLIQLSISLSPLISSIVGLLFGQWSDQIGRRVPFYIAGLFLGVGSLICAFSNTIWFFLIGRTIQSIGAGGLSVLGLSVLGDLFKGVQYARSISIYSMLFPIIFASAPVLGAHLFQWFGWRSNFIAIFVGVLFLFAGLQAFLHETAPCRSTVLRRSRKFYESLTVLGSQFDFWRYSLIHSLPVVAGAIIATNATFVFIQFWNWTPTAYAYLNALWTTLNLFGCFFYFFQVKKKSLFKNLVWGLKIQAFVLVCTGVGMFLSWKNYLSSSQEVVLFSCVVMILQLSLSSVISSGMGQAMRSVPPMYSGMAIAIIHLIRNALVGVGIYLSSLSINGTLLPIYGMVGVVLLVILGLASFRSKNPEITEV